MAYSPAPKAKLDYTAHRGVNINPTTYFLAKRMESVGMLRPGQALMLAATLPNKPPKKGKRK